MKRYVAIQDACPADSHLNTVRRLSTARAYATAICFLVAPTTLFAGNAGPRVIIYYANETPRQALESENYKILLSALRQSKSNLGEEIADSLIADGSKFPTIVERDVSDLSKIAHRFEADLFVFSNTLALQGRFYFRPHGGEGIYRELPVLAISPDHVLNSSPLSRPEQFRSAVSIVAETYRESRAEAVLIANSHGTPEMALMPRVNVDLSLASPDDVMNELLRDDEGNTQPTWANLKGTTKSEFWDVISSISGGRHLQFELIFMEACQSGPYTLNDVRAIPDAVARIAHSGFSTLQPEEVRFSDQNEQGNASWVSAFVQPLTKAGVHVDTRRTMWRWPMWSALSSIPLGLYFVPLLLWIVWVQVWRRLRKSPAVERFVRQ